MKSSFFFFLFSSFCLISFGQDPEPIPPPPPPVVMPEGDEAVQFAEAEPVYPGGTPGLQSFLAKNLNYPVEAKEKNLEGRVFVKLIVEKDGSVSNVQVVRGVPSAPMLDKEAARVVKMLKFEKPAMQSGKPVRFIYTVPVVFKLK
jgi:periplasmic protein TonB